MAKHDRTWTVQDARAHFGDVIDAALKGRPQRVTRRGKDAVVVVSEEEWCRLARPEPAMSLGEYLATYPLEADDIDLTEHRRRPARPNPFADLDDE
jgi:antitoxin Phd